MKAFYDIFPTTEQNLWSCLSQEFCHQSARQEFFLTQGTQSKWLKFNEVYFMDAGIDLLVKECLLEESSVPITVAPLKISYMYQKIGNLNFIDPQAVRTIFRTNKKLFTFQNSPFKSLISEKRVVALFNYCCLDLFEEPKKIPETLAGVPFLLLASKSITTFDSGVAKFVARNEFELELFPRNQDLFVDITFSQVLVKMFNNHFGDIKQISLSYLYKDQPVEEEEAEDHTIFIAEVEDVVVRRGDPLLYFRNKYQQDWKGSSEVIHKKARHPLERRRRAGGTRRRFNIFDSGINSLQRLCTFTSGL